MPDGGRALEDAIDEREGGGPARECAPDVALPCGGEDSAARQLPCLGGGQRGTEEDDELAPLSQELREQEAGDEDLHDVQGETFRGEVDRDGPGKARAAKGTEDGAAGEVEGTFSPSPPAGRGPG